MIRSFGKANENDSGSSPFDLFDIMFGELFRNYEMLRRKTRTEKGIESIHLPVPLLILRRKRVQVATHSRRKGLQDVVCPHLWYRRFCSRMKGKRNKGDPSIRRNKRRENEEDEGETRGEGVGWGGREGEKKQAGHVWGNKRHPVARCRRGRWISLLHLSKETRKTRP